MAYYRSARDRFLATLADETPADVSRRPATYPEPVEHCDVCRWAAECVARRRADDHLSLVAGITRAPAAGADRARRRDARGARRPRRCRWTPPLEGIGDGALERVREQARIQLEGRRELRPQLRAAPARRRARRSSPERGLASLPAAVAGRPVLRHRGRPVRARRRARLPVRRPRAPTATFHAIWSRDDGGRVHARRRAGARSSGSIDLIMDRLDARPDDARLPLRAVRADRAQAADGPLRRRARRRSTGCCAAASSSTCCASSASRSGRRSRATRSSSWSRSTASCARSTCATPGSSIVAFEEWLELGEGERPAADAPRADRALQPRRRRQQPAPARLARGPARRAGAPRPGARSRGRRPATRRCPAELTEAAGARRRRSSSGWPDPTSSRPTRPSGRRTQQATWLLAQLLGWHRREDKSMWWEFHRLMDLTPEQLVDEDDPIGLLEPVGPDRRRRRRASRPGATGSRPGLRPRARPRSTTRPRSRRGRTTAVRLGGRRRRRGRSGRAHRRPAAVVDRAASAGARAARLGPRRRTSRRACSSSASGWPTTASTAPGRHRAARDLLLRLPPRVGQWLGDDAAPAGRDRRSRPRAGSASRSTTRRSRSRGRRARARPTPARG